MCLLHYNIIQWDSEESQLTYEVHLPPLPLGSSTDQDQHQGFKPQALLNYFRTIGHGDLDHDLCPQCHLLVRTNISSKFEGPSPKHCQVIKLFRTKGPDP